MDVCGQIACVTGASGIIGGSTVRKLLHKGYQVRALTRNRSFSIPGTDVYIGGLEDEDILSEFLRGARLVFHCAAELKNEARMRDVNVLGTGRVVRLSRDAGVEYFCFMSSVGVVGLTVARLVDEQTGCNPQNLYEKSKLESENLVANLADACSVVILRPTNVIDDENPGVLSLPLRGNWRDRILVFMKGAELAHIVHADDVAEAAIHSIGIRPGKAERYIVSCDEDERNTYAGLWKLYHSMKYSDAASPLHAPLIVPHVLRLLKQGISA